METDKLSPTSLAFIALTNEYCQLVENCLDQQREQLVESLLKLLPRIYITALDIEPSLEFFDAVISQAAAVMGEEDVYLEVFLDDMKYSDTPIATSISENLADLYQVFYNLIASLRDLNTEEQRQILDECKGQFGEYWGQTLCNVMRALHSLNTSNNQYFDQY